MSTALSKQSMTSAIVGTQLCPLTVYYNLFIKLDSVLVKTKNLSKTLRPRVCVTGYTNTCRMITQTYTAVMSRGNRNLFHPVLLTGGVKTV